MDDMASVGLKVDSRDVRTASGDLDRFAGAGDRAGGSAGRAQGAFAGMGKGLAVAAASALAAVVSIAALSSQLNRFIDATVTNEKAQAQLGAAIASTGGAAGKSVADLNRHAAALQKVTNFGDETINAMQGLLLTFTQIKGDQFDAATKATLDLATAMGTDLNSAALQVGKALNDPVLGMTALARSGIQFTEAQKEMVKGMVDANDTIGAQTIILAELERQFGGSAEAARNTLGGALASLRNAFGDLFELSGPGSENLRASIERLTTAVANPAFFAAVQSIGTALFAAAEMGINALTMLLPVITAVVENIDVIAYSAGIAAAVFVGPYVVAMGAAVIATFSLTAALALLKTALITTGIGALIVGAGYLVAMFGRLVSAVGGAGVAFNLLGNVATEVFGRVSSAFGLVPLAVQAGSASMSSFFLDALRSMLQGFQDLTWSVAQGLNGLFGTNLSGARIGAISDGPLGGAPMDVAVREAEFAATRASRAMETLGSSLTAPLASVGALRDAMAGTSAETDDAAAAAAAMSKTLEDIGGDGTTGSGSGSAGKAAAAIEEATTFAGGFAEAMADGTKSAVEMGRELGGVLLSGIGSVSDAFGEFVMRGFSDFKGFVRSVLDSFKSMLAQMISMAVRNRIMIGLGFSGGGAGAGGVAAQAIGGAGGGGGGLLGGLVGGFGTGGGIAGLANGAGFLGGVGNVLGGLASGGLAGGFGAIGTALGGATASLGGFAMAAGAVALPLLAIVGVFSFFKKKTKELDAGLKVTVNGMDSLVQTFRTIETKRFWGLSKRVRTSITAASKETSDAFTNVVGGLQASVLASADALGIAGSTFDNFAHTLSVSTKGLSDEAAQKAIQDALLGMADAMAGMVGGLARFAITGEGSAATLERLAQSLVAVNGWMGNFRMNLYDVSLAGGGAAAAFVQLFGSLENFNAVSQSYYQNFFTDAERVARATELLSIEMLALGINTLPSTRAAFRALVDEADALGDSRLVASLMQLSPAFAEISAGADALGDSLRALVNEDLFATGQDFTRALSRNSNNQSFTPRESDAELRAELRALNVSMERLVSSSEITAGNTGRGADAADDTLAFQLEQTL